MPGGLSNSCFESLFLDKSGGLHYLSENIKIMRVLLCMCSSEFLSTRSAKTHFVAFYVGFSAVAMLRSTHFPTSGQWL